MGSRRCVIALVVMMFLSVVVFSRSTSEWACRPDIPENPIHELAAAPPEMWKTYLTGDSYSSPVLYDVNSDGVLDVITGSYSLESIYALDGTDGSLIWEHPTGSRLGQGAPSLGDVDDDGDIDIVIPLYDTSEVTVIEVKSRNHVWTASLPTSLDMTPVIVDIDGDGDTEVIVVGDNRWVYALNGNDGSILWSTETHADQCSPAVGDVDGDGDLEVVVSGYGVEVLDGVNGGIEWSFDPGPSAQGYWVSLADLNNDGNLEIVWCNDGGWIHAIRNSTSVLWSVQGDYSCYWSSVGFGDLDSDSLLEIVIGDLDGNVVALNGEDGSLLWCSPTSISGGLMGFKPTVADLTGNGQLDVVLVDGWNRAYAFVGSNGTTLWTYGLESESMCAAACADLDGDGQIEIVLVGYGVRVLNPPNSGFRVYWQGHSGNHHFNGRRNLDEADADMDMLSEHTESLIGTNPNRADTDSDGIPDGWEVSHGLDPLVDDAALDPDSDGLTNLEEYMHGTNPNNGDTDSDGMPDRWEVENGLDPLVDDAALDPDSDGLTNLEEYTHGTDPNDSDTDSDGLSDGDEVNVYSTDPNNDDTDSDGIPDGWEVSHGLDPLVDDAALDPDSDGLTNLEEYMHGTNPNNSDTDSDGMPDGWEVSHGLDPLVDDAALDPDSDGLTNLEEYSRVTDPNNDDTDSDGLSDGDEVNVYSTDPNDSDTDSDGIPDGWEVENGLDPLADDAALDPDSDGLTNLEEYIHGTDPNNGDTDSDGMPDGWEVSHGLDPLVDDAALDPDSDGLTNLEEYSHVTDPNNDDTDSDGLSDGDEVNLYSTDPNDSDTDSDGIPDGWEVENGLDPLVDDGALDPDSDGLTNLEEYTHGTDPNDSDTDSDGLSDGDEVNVYSTDPNNDDTDSDGIPDGWEVENGLDPLADDSALDPDSDGLSNLEEYIQGTDPNDSDTDSDGMPDGWEVSHGLDPLADDSALDSDGDGLTNLEEYIYGTDPNNDDTDSDGLSDGDEVNVYSTDPNNDDTDSDGMPDGWEVENDLDPLADDSALDPDADGLTNLEEYIQGTDPNDGDTDSDGMPDGWEVSHGLDPLVDDAVLDPDSDGLTNLEEYTHGTDPNDSDTDSDGMPDGWEVSHGLDPLVDDAVLDADADGLTNLEEYTSGTDPNNDDTDSDGMPDGWEVENGLDPLVDDAALDPDSDDLTNLEEYTLGTDPNNDDTDFDGMSDGWEVSHGLDPLMDDAALDADGDGLTNLQEYLAGTNPLLVDSDDDGASDWWEVQNGYNPADPAMPIQQVLHLNSGFLLLSSLAAMGVVISGLAARKYKRIRLEASMEDTIDEIDHLLDRHHASSLDDYVSVEEIQRLIAVLERVRDEADHRLKRAKHLPELSARLEERKEELQSLILDVEGLKRELEAPWTASPELAPDYEGSARHILNWVGAEYQRAKNLLDKEDFEAAHNALLKITEHFKERYDELKTLGPQSSSELLPKIEHDRRVAHVKSLLKQANEGLEHIKKLEELSADEAAQSETSAQIRKREQEIAKTVSRAIDFSQEYRLDALEAQALALRERIRGSSQDIKRSLVEKTEAYEFLKQRVEELESILKTEPEAKSEVQETLERLEDALNLLETESPRLDLSKEAAEESDHILERAKKRIDTLQRVLKMMEVEEELISVERRLRGVIEFSEDSSIAESERLTLLRKEMDATGELLRKLRRYPTLEYRLKELVAEAKGRIADLETVGKTTESMGKEELESQVETQAEAIATIEGFLIKVRQQLESLSTLGEGSSEYRSLRRKMVESLAQASAIAKKFELDSYSELISDVLSQLRQ